MIKIDRFENTIEVSFYETVRTDKTYNLSELVGEEVYYKTAKVYGKINDKFQIVWDDGVESTDMLDSINDIVLQHCELV